MKELLEGISKIKKERIMNMAGFGKAKVNGTFEKVNNWKLKDGESVFRIIPPMGNLADSGKWSMFYSVHFGYKNSRGKMRVFQSPLVKNRKTKMVEQPDAALERIEKIKSELSAARAAGNKSLAAKLETLAGGQKSLYNLDSNHYVVAVDLQGNVGVLRLRHRAKMALDATIKRLMDSGVNPLDVENGRYFRFIRSGSGLDTTFQVEVLKEKINVEGLGTVERDVVHSLTQEIVSKLMDKEGKVYKPYRLDELYKRPTSAQVQRIVEEGVTAVDDILDNGTASEEDMSEESMSMETQETSSTSSESVSANVNLESINSFEAIRQGALAEAARQSAVAKASVETAEVGNKNNTAKTTAQTLETTSDEEFLKSMGLA
jgi:hypothetical protein